MSVFKPFLTSDVIVSPFKVNKLFTFQGNELTGSNVEIDRYLGKNIINDLWISGSNPTGYINIQDQILIYNSIKELYYSNFLEGNNGSPAGTASFNADGTITGPAYTPNYYNYLPNTLLADRYFPTGSDDVVGIISIPSNLYGEYIKPGSFYLSLGGTPPPSFNDYIDDDYIDNYFTSLSYTSTVIHDDGEGNLISNNLKVGDIIYEHGLVIITSDGVPQQDGYGFVTYEEGLYDMGDVSFIQSFINSPDLICSFQSTTTIIETQYKCTIRANEFTFSQNNTLISGSSNSGVIYDFATGSFFNPYVTTIGLYDNSYNLLAVAKLSQPLPLSSVTDTNILINLDL